MHQGRHVIDTTYRVAVLRIHARLVRLGFVLLWENAICGKIDDFEFLLVDLGGFVAGYGRPLVKGIRHQLYQELACLRGPGGRCSRGQG